jgi:hypothetical protein
MAVVMHQRTPKSVELYTVPVLRRTCTQSVPSLIGITLLSPMPALRRVLMEPGLELFLGGVDNGDRHPDQLG